MKCPKCGYLGFEHVDRCRNCGYDFSLSSSVASVELPLKGDPEENQPIEDLSFGREPVAAAQTRTAPASAELPLFGRPIPDDLPLITKPSPPRPPLAVRRATPEVPRVRATPLRTPTLDLSGEPEVPVMPPPAMAASRAIEGERSDRAAPDPTEDAHVAARFLAVVIDVLILAAIDAVVVYFTMQICGIGIDDLGLLPRVPLLAFLFVQNGGYLVAFTAGGQTLGKMAVGIKVVSAEPRSSVDLGRAFVRELAWVVLAAPAGLGLLTVLSRDHRGIHDRFAGTRVVRASS